ncbi:hypothetical protein F5B19DRAFT_456383 [Rostrohypoxylon terebratum]|nr:hypothetical protein F5B19DRAFT_456383 [Rostrohypoxylon terebratum]
MMDALPQEIKVKIASFLPKTLASDIPSKNGENGEEAALIRPGIASLSHSWKAAIETVTFTSIDIESKELRQFSLVFKEIQRRKTLRELTYRIELRAYGDEECADFETDEDRITNNQTASRAISDLLRELAAWPSDLNIDELSIEIYSPMDMPYREEDKLDQDRNAVYVGTRKDLFTRRYRYSYIHLEDLDKLQVQIPFVHYLNLSSTHRVFDPASIIALTAKFPSLPRISWNYTEPGPFVLLRKQLRNNFVSSLETFKFAPETKRLSLGISPPFYYHHQRLPNLIGSLPNDPLCAALHNVISRSSLEKLSYNGPIDPSFFWPTKSEDSHLTWPRITDMTIEFDLASPSGKWYFKGAANDPYNKPASDEPLPASDQGYNPPGYGNPVDEPHAVALEASTTIEPEEGAEDEEYFFRKVPNEEVMVPLLEAFARRLATMPSVQSAQLTTNMPVDEGEWFVQYDAPGYSNDYESYTDEPNMDLSTARVFFHVKDWKPEKHLLDQFRKIGKELHGKYAIVSLLPFLY